MRYVRSARGSNRLACGLRSVGAVLLLLAGVLPLEAQFTLSPRNLGMGGALLSGARGEESLFQNPANLGLPGNPYWSVAIPQATLGVTVAGVVPGDIGTFVRLQKMPDEDKDRIFATVPDAGLEGRFTVRAPLASIQRNRFAVGVAYQTAGEHTFSKDLVELAMYGYEDGRADYRAGNTAGSRISYWDFALGFGERIGPVSLGAAAHYRRGGTLMRSWMPEPHIDLVADEVEIDYVSVASRGGEGYALDLGAAYQPHPTVTLGAAVANLFSTMRWTDDLYVRHLRLTRDDLDYPIPLELITEYNVSERPLVPQDAELTRGLTASDLQAQVRLPAELRLGAGWQPFAGTLLGLTYRSTLDREPLGGSWERALGMGVQQRLIGSILILRAGYASDLDRNSMLTAGALLGALEVGVGRLSTGRFHTVDREGWVAAAGLGIGTRGLRP